MATFVALRNVSGAEPHSAIRVYGEHVLPQLRVFVTILISGLTPGPVTFRRGCREIGLSGPITPLARVRPGDLAIRVYASSRFSRCSGACDNFVTRA